MAEQKNHQRITAIVPAYNEAERIGSVLEVLTTYPDFQEVIVVDDGSTDNTAEVVKRYKVRYVRNKVNKGKGYAMDVGVKLARGDIIFFSDADMLGLSHRMIDEITSPVLDGEVDMFFGMCNRRVYYLHYLVVFIPLLGGERALTRALWRRLPDYYKASFKVEAGLNFYAKYYGRGFGYKIFKKLSQIAKEKKYGFWQGTKQRWAMMSNVVCAQFKLQFVDIPKTIQNIRTIIFLALQSLVGVILGLIVFVANYIPRSLNRILAFAEGLDGGFMLSLTRFFVYLVKMLSVNIIAIFGILIVAFNLTVFFFASKKLIDFLYRPSAKRAKNTLRQKIETVSQSSK